jgi:nucleotidyltransferase substrate binding protein (TIGR01987 family)
MNRKTINDLHLKQRITHFVIAFSDLQNAFALAGERELTDLEKKGVIHIFGLIHEFAWNLMKDYLEENGVFGLIGSTDTTRRFFNEDLITDGETWMAMINSRKMISRIYDSDTSRIMARYIMDRYFPAFKELSETFKRIFADRWIDTIID